MRARVQASFVAAALLAAGLAACGGSPTTPPPPPPVPPPANALPSIDGITVQGRRTRQPAQFADLRETVDVAATVRDAETSVDELAYQWSATAGTFSGTGRSVTWTAPDAAVTPGTVTITLKVVEAYGHPGQAKIYSQDVSGTQTLSLHDSAKEVGDMSVRFLTEFSKPQTNKDWQDIMKDFKGAACPDAGEVANEKDDVINHYSFFTMHNYRIDPAVVSFNFKGVCAYKAKAGDACVSVPLMWDSTDGRTGSRKTTTGTDHLTAAYSSIDGRWWLCSSYFQDAAATFGHAFYSR